MDLDAIRERVARDGRWDTDDAVEAFMDRDALLTAFDALTKERDAMVAHLEEGMRMITALQRERDQATARLAVVEALFAEHSYLREHHRPESRGLRCTVCPEPYPCAVVDLLDNLEKAVLDG